MAARHARFRVYKARNGRWYFDCCARNGKWVAGSSETDGFDTPSKAKRAIKSFVKAIAQAEQFEVEVEKS